MVNVSSELENGIYFIKVEGEVDASSSIYLDNAVSEALQNDCNAILIDCNNLNYISSAGLGVFMSHLDEINQRNIQLILFGIQNKVYKVFEILGLHELITITETREEAKAYVK